VLLGCGDVHNTKTWDRALGQVYGHDTNLYDTRDGNHASAAQRHLREVCPEMEQHVRVLPQFAMNSYVCDPPDGIKLRDLKLLDKCKNEQERLRNASIGDMVAIYKPGDFIAHMASITTAWKKTAMKHWANVSRAKLEEQYFPWSSTRDLEVFEYCTTTHCTMTSRRAVPAHERYIVIWQVTLALAVAMSVAALMCVFFGSLGTDHCMMYAVSIASTIIAPVAGKVVLAYVPLPCFLACVQLLLGTVLYLVARTALLRLRPDPACWTWLVEHPKEILMLAICWPLAIVSLNASIDTLPVTDVILLELAVMVLANRVSDCDTPNAFAGMLDKKSTIVLLCMLGSAMGTISDYKDFRLGFVFVHCFAVVAVRLITGSLSHADRTAVMPIATIANMLGAVGMLALSFAVGELKDWPEVLAQEHVWGSWTVVSVCIVSIVSMMQLLVQEEKQSSSPLARAAITTCTVLTAATMFPDVLDNLRMVRFCLFFFASQGFFLLYHYQRSVTQRIDQELESTTKRPIPQTDPMSCSNQELESPTKRTIPQTDPRSSSDQELKSTTKRTIRQTDPRSSSDDVSDKKRLFAVWMPRWLEISCAVLMSYLFTTALTMVNKVMLAKDALPFPCFSSALGVLTLGGGARLLVLCGKWEVMAISWKEYAQEILPFGGLSFLALCSGLYALELMPANLVQIAKVGTPVIMMCMNMLFGYIYSLTDFMLMGVIIFGLVCAMGTSEMTSTDDVNTIGLIACFGSGAIEALKIHMCGKVIQERSYQDLLYWGMPACAAYAMVMSAIVELKDLVHMLEFSKLWLLAASSVLGALVNATNVWMQLCLGGLNMKMITLSRNLIIGVVTTVVFHEKWDGTMIVGTLIAFCGTATWMQLNSDDAKKNKSVERNKTEPGPPSDANALEQPQQLAGPLEQPQQLADDLPMTHIILCVSIQFTFQFLFTTMIPLSEPLLGVQGGASMLAISGLLIGVMHIASPLAVAMCHLCPWGPRTQLLLCIMTAALGACLLAVATCLRHSTANIVCLFGGRILLGASSGAAMLAREYAASLVKSVESRQRVMSWIFRAGDLGLAAGPLVSMAAITWLESSNSLGCVLSLISLVICSVIAVGVARAIPYEWQSRKPVPVPMPTLKSNANARRDALVSSLSTSVCRVFCQAAWETTSMDVLPHQLGMSSMAACACISVPIFCTIPCQVALIQCRSLVELSDSTISSIALCVSFLGALMLSTASMIHYGVYIAGSALFMCGLSVSATMNDSMALTVATTGYITLQDVVFWQVFCQSIGGRLLGPPIGRFVYGDYATAGLVVCLCIVLMAAQVIWFMVLRSAEKEMVVNMKSQDWWVLRSMPVMSLCCGAVLAPHFLSIQDPHGDFVMLAVMVLLVFACIAIWSPVKQVWMARLGMSTQEIERVFTPLTFDLASYTEKYGRNALRMCDGVIRKGNHICFNVGKLIIIGQSSRYDKATVLTGATLCYFIFVSAQLVTVHQDNWIVNKVVFGGAPRVLDGRFRRWNVVFANASSFMGLLCVIMISGTWSKMMLAHEIEKALLVILWVPLGIGDALAEICGVLFGRQFFAVHGMGEVNEKSIEGCLGMFLSVVLIDGCVVFNLYLKSLITDLLAWLLFVVALALVTTMAETWSPRSTDNFSITTLGAGLAYVFLTIHGP